MKYNKLMLDQIEKKLTTWNKIKKIPSPPRGWVHLIRTGLGLSSYGLAKRMGVNQSRVMQIEAAECQKSVTLKTLEHAADAMGCKLVYGIIPKTSLKNIRQNQAQLIAKKRLESIAHSMALENQEVDMKRQNKQLKMLVDELLTGPAKNLWSDK